MYSDPRRRVIGFDSRRLRNQQHVRGATIAADRSNAQPHQLIHRSGTAARSPARCPANYVRHRRQAFVQYEGGDVVDAAVLIMPLVKFISLVAPQWLTTLDAVGANLVSDT